jgi:hypothetical protein
VALWHPVVSSTVSGAADRVAAVSGPRSRSDPTSTSVTAQRVSAVVTRLLQRHDTTTRRADVGASPTRTALSPIRTRTEFFALLAREFWNDPVAVDHAIAARDAAGDDPARRAAERELRNAPHTTGFSAAPTLYRYRRRREVPHRLSARTSSGSRQGRSRPTMPVPSPQSTSN